MIVNKIGNVVKVITWSKKIVFLPSVLNTFCLIYFLLSAKLSIDFLFFWKSFNEITILFFFTLLLVFFILNVVDKGGAFEKLKSLIWPVLLNLIFSICLLQASFPQGPILLYLFR